MFDVVYRYTHTKFLCKIEHYCVGADTVSVMVSSSMSILCSVVIRNWEDIGVSHIKTLLFYVLLRKQVFSETTYSLQTRQRWWSHIEGRPMSTIYIARYINITDHYPSLTPPPAPKRK